MIRSNARMVLKKYFVDGLDVLVFILSKTPDRRGLRNIEQTAFCFLTALRLRLEESIFVLSHLTA